MQTSTQPESVPKLAYAINELQAVTSLSRSTIYVAISQGDLVARKKGKRTIVLKTDLDAWLGGLEHSR